MYVQGTFSGIRGEQECAHQHEQVHCTHNPLVSVCVCACVSFGVCTNGREREALNDRER